MDFKLYVAEFIGTALLILIGNGSVANNFLAKCHNKESILRINIAWGLAVFVAATSVGWISGAHLNPALSIALFIGGSFDAVHVAPYIIAQILGAMFGSLLVYLAFKKHYDETTDQGTIKGTFCTSSAIDSKPWAAVTEAFGTFILFFAISAFNHKAYNFGNLGPVLVGLTVIAIGASLGAPTGYAINPARDLGPRIFHALFPLKNKGDSDWSYAWVPIVGPIIGGTLGVLAYNFMSSLG